MARPRGLPLLVLGTLLAPVALASGPVDPCALDPASTAEAGGCIPLPCDPEGIEILVGFHPAHYSVDVRCAGRTLASCEIPKDLLALVAEILRSGLPCRLGRPAV